MPDESPFTKVLGFDPTIGEWRKSELQRLVADCMNDRGFEYTPYVSPERDVLADAEVAGYGLAAAYLPGGAPLDGDENPNEQRMEAMTDEERLAYETALVGPVRQAEDVTPASEQGCVVLAQETLYGQAGAISGALQDALSEVSAAAAASSVMQRVEAEWAACMAERGYEFSERAAAFATMERRRDEIVRPVGQGDGVAVVEGAPEEEELREFLEVEIEVAVADLACAERVRYTDQEIGQLLAQQQRYLDAHPGFASEVFDDGT